MPMNGYEIRHAILNEAREMLFEQWRMAMDVENATARFEGGPHAPRPPKLLPPPTVAEIKALAESMYEFVQTK
jgi:hypothetical protein